MSTTPDYRRSPSPERLPFAVERLIEAERSVDAENPRPSAVGSALPD
jgi:hypothetical protein